MIQPGMVNPYTSAAKTAEIMSRYRPIAPRPVDGGAATGDGSCGGMGGTEMSVKIQQSPYLRHLWPKLQARPTRTRKRGRMIGVAVSPSAFKRTSPPQPPQAAFLGLSPPPQFFAVNNAWLCSGFLPAEKTVAPPVKVTLPLLPTSPASETSPVKGGKGVDLKSMVEKEMSLDGKDLTLRLRGPAESSASGNSVNVISPRPVRPVGSCITVASMTPVKPNLTPLTTVNEKWTTCLTESIMVNGTMTAADVEAEMEAEELPAIVTDSRNRVRLTNSAYNKMVGQPECMWLETMSPFGGSGSGRIGGEVAIKSTAALSAAHFDKFKGWARIEWGSKDAVKAVVDARCVVDRLRCASKDYLFAWRFTAAQ